MTIAYNDAPAGSRRNRTGIFGTVASFFSLLARSIEAANAYESLNQMTDAQLARRGLTRADIAPVAMKVLLDTE
jgi:uncharacterized protein YjiS (DUF1127 family)